MTTTSAAISVVTGANSGIGRAVAIHLAGEGHTVYGTVRSVDKAAKLQAMAAEANVEVRLVELDVAEDESVRAGLAQVLDEVGRIDVLVNNAGVGGNGAVEHFPPCGNGAAERSSTSPPSPVASRRSPRRRTWRRSGRSRE
jgi:NAD(P)-dependent dehydrogenase (short-subunit alcohol dehydrogenase family)